MPGWGDILSQAASQGYAMAQERKRKDIEQQMQQQDVAMRQQALNQQQQQQNWQQGFSDRELAQQKSISDAQAQNTSQRTFVDMVKELRQEIGGMSLPDAKRYITLKYAGMPDVQQKMLSALGNGPQVTDSNYTSGMVPQPLSVHPSLQMGYKPAPSLGVAETPTQPQMPPGVLGPPAPAAQPTPILDFLKMAQGQPTTQLPPLYKQQPFTASTSPPRDMNNQEQNNYVPVPIAQDEATKLAIAQMKSNTDRQTQFDKQTELDRKAYQAEYKQLWSTITGPNSWQLRLSPGQRDLINGSVNDFNSKWTSKGFAAIPQAQVAQALQPTDTDVSRGLTYGLKNTLTQAQTDIANINKSTLDDYNKKRLASMDSQIRRNQAEANLIEQSTNLTLQEKQARISNLAASTTHIAATTADIQQLMQYREQDRPLVMAMKKMGLIKNYSDMGKITLSPVDQTLLSAVPADMSDMAARKAMGEIQKAGLATIQLDPITGRNKVSFSFDPSTDPIKQKQVNDIINKNYTGAGGKAGVFAPNAGAALNLGNQVMSGASSSFKPTNISNFGNPIAGIVAKRALALGLDPVKAQAQAYVESGWNNGAVANEKNGTKSYGVMQINSVHPNYDVNKGQSNPAYNIDYGLQMIKNYMDQNGADYYTAARKGYNPTGDPLYIKKIQLVESNLRNGKAPGTGMNQLSKASNTTSNNTVAPAPVAAPAPTPAATAPASPTSNVSSNGYKDLTDNEANQIVTIVRNTKLPFDQILTQLQSQPYFGPKYLANKSALYGRLKANYSRTHGG